MSGTGGRHLDQDTCGSQVTSQAATCEPILYGGMEKSSLFDKTLRHTPVSQDLVKSGVRFHFPVLVACVFSIYTQWLLMGGTTTVSWAKFLMD